MKKIYLTVDTECHNIDKVNQYIYGKVGNKEYGIVKILELAKEYKIPVNFFLDVGESRKYGREFIKNIVDTIHSYNQPVFFHLHPDYISNDSRTYLWEYSKEEQKEIILSALEDYKSFVDNGDKLVFRAGRYGVNLDTYDILSELGYDVLDLSYLCNNNKMCKIDTNEIQTMNAPTKYNNITILPNTQFVGFDLLGKKKCIGVDSSDATYSEFKKIIKNSNLKNIVFTMHSWNFIKKWFFEKEYIQGDRAMERKFRKSIVYARKCGYEFENLSNFQFGNDKDELINFYSKNKIGCVINNFFRFQKIARLNKKYFAFYTAFYLCILTLFFILFLLFI